MNGIYGIDELKALDHKIIPHDEIIKIYDNPFIKQWEFMYNFNESTGEYDLDYKSYKVTLVTDDIVYLCFTDYYYEILKNWQIIKIAPTNTKEKYGISDAKVKISKEIKDLFYFADEWKLEDYKTLNNHVLPYKAVNELVYAKSFFDIEIEKFVEDIPTLNNLIESVLKLSDGTYIRIYYKYEINYL